MIVCMSTGYTRALTSAPAQSVTMHCSTRTALKPELPPAKMMLTACGQIILLHALQDQVGASAAPIHVHWLACRQPTCERLQHGAAGLVDTPSCSSAPHVSDAKVFIVDVHAIQLLSRPKHIIHQALLVHFPLHTLLQISAEQLQTVRTAACRSPCG